MRYRLFARFLLAGVAACVATVHTISTQPQPDRWNQTYLTAVLEAYLAGRHDEAVTRAAAIEDLAPFRLHFVQDVPLWINADATAIDRRRAAAAAFLLELTHARLESDWLRLADLIEWMCLDQRARPASPFERAWQHASIALAGRARARLWLLGEFAVLPHQKPVKVREQPKNPSPKHLMHALDRFPDDSRLQLARIVAWTWGRDREPTRNVAPRPEPPPMVRRRPPQMEAVVALEPLVEDPAVGAEALVRIGQMHLTVGDFAAALRSFEAARPRALDTPIQYLSRFLSGRALEALKRPADAGEQYQRALVVWPGAESATVALSALQFVSDDRAAAVALLRDNLSTPPRGDDPGRLLGYGMFVHWGALRAAMRAEIAR